MCAVRWPVTIRSFCSLPICWSQMMLTGLMVEALGEDRGVLRGTAFEHLPGMLLAALGGKRAAGVMIAAERSFPSGTPSSHQRAVQPKELVYVRVGTRVPGHGRRGPHTKDGRG